MNEGVIRVNKLEHVDCNVTTLSSSAAAKRLFWAAAKVLIVRVRTIVQKSDSPIVDSIGQNNLPMQWRCDSFSASITVKQYCSINNSN